MFERGITTKDVRTVIESGEIIADYPSDLPFPSCLILGWANDKPVHLVIAKNETYQQCYVVTAYIPDQAIWGSDFKTRETS
jgi:hypothetical protein